MGVAIKLLGLTLCILQGAFPAPKDIVTDARKLYDSNPEKYASVASELWRVRKRVATQSDLLAMAIEAEEGEGGCNCGKTGQPAMGAERQARGLAEAAILYHASQDETASKNATNKLRNLASQNHDSEIIWELFIRTAAILEGPKVIQETTPLEPTLRIHALSASTLTTSLKPDLAKTLVTQSLTEFQRLPPNEQLKNGRWLALALQEVGMTNEAQQVAQASPLAKRELEKKNAASLTPTPTSEKARRILDVLQTPTQAKSRLEAVPEELRTFVAMEVARQANPAQSLELTQNISPPAKLGLLLGTAEKITANHKLPNEDITLTHLP